jgi:hypothetical protein
MKNVEKCYKVGRPQIIWRMRTAYWITKATNTLSGYAVLIVFNCNNGCTNAPPCHIIRTLPNFFVSFRLLPL